MLDFVMSITKSAVERVAHLARIHIEPADIDKYAFDLSQILDLVEQMDLVPTSKVEPLAHPQDIELRLRPDLVTEINARARLQAVAPAAERGLYLVPRIIE
jgi:aspartyl-tRNA(Asn)/glutamyl-tRNA(Gln) amidotransferase subunit C